MINIPTKSLRSGLAVGGPLAGEVLATDYPKGIIIVDRPKNRAWVYDWNFEDRKFHARPEQDLKWEQSEKFNIRRAMEQNNYEVRSHPRAGEDY
jgi:hypothetical protein